MSKQKSYDNSVYYDTDSTPYNRYIGELRNYLLQKEEQGTRFTSNNAAHVVLSINGDHPAHQIQEWLDGFTAKIASTLLVPLARVSCCGLLLLQPHTHIHLCIRTPKSRKTGYSIARMPDEIVESLCSFWEGLAGKPDGKNRTGMMLKPIYNLGGVLEYWAGTENLSRPGQRFLPILSK